MKLERDDIERTDFAQARRGYDPEEVDRHLAELAAAVEELKRAQADAPQAQAPAPARPGTLAGVAADQVRTIVEAAERSAAEIESSAKAEAARLTSDAKRQADEDRDAARADAERTRGEAAAAAQETRERAESEAAEHVSKVQEATSGMRRRADTVESDLGGLVEELRGTVSALVESVRANAGSLESELQGMRAGLADVREATPEPAVEPELVAADQPLGDIEDESVVIEEEEGVVVEEVVAGPAATAYDEELGTAEEREPSAEEPALVEEIETETVVVEPEPGEEPVEAGAGNGDEGARLIALNMALNGTPRDETARYLEENFDLVDQDTILDEVYARVSG